MKTKTLSDYPLLIGEILKRSDKRKARRAKHAKFFKFFAVATTVFAFTCFASAGTVKHWDPKTGKWVTEVGGVDAIPGLHAVGTYDANGVHMAPGYELHWETVYWTDDRGIVHSEQSPYLTYFGKRITD